MWFQQSATLYEPAETVPSERRAANGSIPMASKAAAERACWPMWRSETAGHRCRAISIRWVPPSAASAEDPAAIPTSLPPSQVAVGGGPSRRSFGPDWPHRRCTGVRD